MPIFQSAYRFPLLSINKYSICGKYDYLQSYIAFLCFQFFSKNNVIQKLAESGGLHWKTFSMTWCKTFALLQCQMTFGDDLLLVKEHISQIWSYGHQILILKLLYPFCFRTHSIHKNIYYFCGQSYTKYAQLLLLSHNVLKMYKIVENFSIEEYPFLCSPH